jgi:hypothetical protein
MGIYREIKNRISPRLSKDNNLFKKPKLMIKMEKLKIYLKSINKKSQTVDPSLKRVAQATPINQSLILGLKLSKKAIINPKQSKLIETIKN